MFYKESPSGFLVKNGPSFCTAKCVSYSRLCVCEEPATAPQSPSQPRAGQGGSLASLAGWCRSQGTRSGAAPLSHTVPEHLQRSLRLAQPGSPSCPALPSSRGQSSAAGCAPSPGSARGTAPGTEQVRGDREHPDADFRESGWQR